MSVVEDLVERLITLINDNAVVLRLDNGRATRIDGEPAIGLEVDGVALFIEVEEA